MPQQGSCPAADRQKLWTGQKHSGKWRIPQYNGTKTPQWSGNNSDPFQQNRRTQATTSARLTAQVSSPDQISDEPHPLAVRDLYLVGHDVVDLLGNAGVGRWKRRHFAAL